MEFGENKIEGPLVMEADLVTHIFFFILIRSAGNSFGVTLKPCFR